MGRGLRGGGGRVDGEGRVGAVGHWARGVVHGAEERVVAVARGQRSGRRVEKALCFGGG